MNYGVDEVQQAIDGITGRLGCSPAKALQAEYEAGLHPNLLNYDKIDTPLASVPALTKYLVGAGSFLHQPANFYHIFGTCRCVNLIQFLERAVKRLTSTHVEGIHVRFERLITEKKRDAFEAIAFELITAARYLEHPAVTSIRFIEETPTKQTPDFVVSTGLFELYVECKKIDRTQDFTLQIRNAARDLINPVLKSFRDNSKSVVADITFHSDPRNLSSHKLQKIFEVALRKQVPIIDQDFTVIAKQPSRYETGTITLCPSPALWWERYSYRVRSEWIGIVNALDCQWAHRSDLPKDLSGGMSTWINDIAWEEQRNGKLVLTISWTNIDDSHLTACSRVSIKFKGKASTLLCTFWLESDYYTGGT